MKQCTKCKEWKPRDSFYARKQNRDGLRSWCKQCEIAYQSQYKKTEAGKTTQQRYNQSDKAKARDKRYQGTLKAHQRVSRYNKSEKGKLYHRKARLRHLKEVQARDAINNAIKAGKLEPASKNPCSYYGCVKKAEEFHHHCGYDEKHWLHVVPLCIKHHRMIHNNN